MLAQLIAAAVAGQAPDIAQLNWLIGRWEGTGSSFGSPGSAQLEFSPALEGKFIELRYRVATSGSRPFRFEGRALYRPTGQSWGAQWFDSRGATLTITARADAAALTANWSGATERGQTVYRLRADRRLEVVDSVSSADGKLREFARYVYSRALP